MSDIRGAADPAAVNPMPFARAAGDRLAGELMRLPTVARYAASLFAVGLTTGLALALERLAAPSNMALFFVAPVVLTATAFGWGPSLAAVVAGVLAFDFFFTEPRYSLEIASPSDIWAAGLLLLIAAMVSSVAAAARRRLEEARRDAIRSEALRALAHMVVEGRSAQAIVEAAAATLARIFEAPAVVFDGRSGTLAPAALSAGARISEAELAAAREVAHTRIVARGEVYPFPQSRFDLWPLTTRAGARCVLGVDFTRAGVPRPRAPERFVEVVAAYLATAGN